MNKWQGPYRIERLLDDLKLVRSIPEKDSVYVVSEKSWHNKPDKDILYVGSNTGLSPRFRTRIGDLIIDSLGFFNEERRIGTRASGHSGGGIKLYNYCRDNSLNPKKLFIGWLDKTECTRCTEYLYYKLLKPKLNTNRPPKCVEHRT